MTYKSKELSIEELCAPLSAKIIPKRCRVGDGGNELTENQALMRARYGQNFRRDVSKKVQSKK